MRRLTALVTETVKACLPPPSSKQARFLTLFWSRTDIVTHIRLDFHKHTDQRLGSCVFSGPSVDVTLASRLGLRLHGSIWPFAAYPMHLRQPSPRAAAHRAKLAACDLAGKTIHIFSGIMKFSDNVKMRVGNPGSPVLAASSIGKVLNDAL